MRVNALCQQVGSPNTGATFAANGIISKEFVNSIKYLKFSQNPRIISRTIENYVADPIGLPNNPPVGFALVDGDNVIINELIASVAPGAGTVFDELFRPLTKFIRSDMLATPLYFVSQK